MLGFALAPDGSRVYAGGPEDGVFAANAATLLFARTSTEPVQCLAVSAGELWACAPESSGFVAGSSADDGAHFSPKLQLNGIRGPLSCPVATPAQACAGPAFQELCMTLQGCAGAAKPTDGAADARQADGPEDPERGGTLGGAGGSGGCSTVGGAGAGFMVGTAGLAALLRRRRRVRAGEW
jgi:uncharacterized protein (TIGR03382 family)